MASSCPALVLMTGAMCCLRWQSSNCFLVLAPHAASVKPRTQVYAGSPERLAAAQAEAALQASLNHPGTHDGPLMTVV